MAPFGGSNPRPLRLTMSGEPHDLSLLFRRCQSPIFYHTRKTLFFPAREADYLRRLLHWNNIGGRQPRVDVLGSVPERVLKNFLAACWRTRVLAAASQRPFPLYNVVRWLGGLQIGQGQKGSAADEDSSAAFGAGVLLIGINTDSASGLPASGLDRFCAILHKGPEDAANFKRPFLSFL